MAHLKNPQQADHQCGKEEEGGGESLEKPQGMSEVRQPHVKNEVGNHVKNEVGKLQVRMSCKEEHSKT